MHERGSTSLKGRRRRRSKAAFVAALMALVVTAGYLVKTPSFAGEGANVTWRITSEPAEARTSYATMLNDIRAAVSTGRVSHDPTQADRSNVVDITDIAGGSRYITIDLHADGRPEMIRAVMRRSDQYIVGWFQGVEDGGGTVTLGSFFPLEPNLQGVPGATADNTNPRHDRLVGYNALAAQGAAREGMQISPSSLNDAVLNLQAGEAIDGAIAARSILQVLVGVAEASRFRNQAAETATAFGRGAAIAITAAHVARHNNWSVLSRVFLTAVIAGVTVLAAPVEIGGVLIATTAAVAALLLVAHHSDLPDIKGKHLP